MTLSTAQRKAIVEAAWTRGWGYRRIAAKSFPRISPATVRRILRRFKKYGDFDTPCGGKRNHRGKIPDAVRQWLVNYLETKDSTLYLDEMRDLLKRRFGIAYRANLICATLLRFKYTRKKLTIIQDGAGRATWSSTWSLASALTLR